MRRIYTKRTEHVDNETGEVTYSEQTSSFFVKSRHFVKVFLDHIHLLQELTGGARCLLDIILVEMEFNENSVYISRADREKLAKLLDKSEHTIRNYMYELEQADIIAKTGANVYRINPNLFQKGGRSSENVYEPDSGRTKKPKSPL